MVAAWTHTVAFWSAGTMTGQFSSLVRYSQGGPDFNGSLSFIYFILHNALPAGFRVRLRQNT